MWFSALSSRTARKLRLLGLCVFFVWSGVLGCHVIGPDPLYDTNHRHDLQPPTSKTVASFANRTRLSFIYFADIQVDQRMAASIRIPALEFLRDYLKKKPVDFFVSGGDNTENGLLKEYEFVETQIQSLQVPVFWCLGNHDLFNSGWVNWKKRHGTSMKHLRLGSLSLYILDNAGGTIGLKQRTWLEEALKKDTATHKVATMHYPMYPGTNYELDSGQAHVQETLLLSTMFEKYKVKTVLGGHSHIYREVTLNGIRYITASALKENSPNKMFLRVNINGNQLTTETVRVNLEGYKQ
jgi:3',5'-cyclic AMP phosphodiesterase CpdA